MSEIEMCWRCPTPMSWVHGTWQCARCRFKLGCCEGDPQTACDGQERAPSSAPADDKRDG